MLSSYILICACLIIKSSYAVIQVPAFGRPFDIAKFYDLNKDSLHPVSAITSMGYPKRSVIPQLQGNVEVTSSIVKSLEDRLSSLGLDLKAKVSVMTGVTGAANGAIKYINEDQSDLETVYGVIRYKKFTLYETLHTRLRSVQSQLSLFPAKVLPATHLVIGVMWGIEIVISFQFRKQAQSSSKLSSVELEASLGAIAYSMELGVKLSNSNATSRLFSNTEIKIYSDLAINALPRTLDDIDALLEEIPNLLEETNGKGKPQYYDVIELGKLQEIIDYDMLLKEIKTSQPRTNMFFQPDVVRIETWMLRVLEKKERALTLITMWKKRIQNLEFLFDSSFLFNINNIYSNFVATFTYFNSKFKVLLQNCRLNANVENKLEFKQTKSRYLNHEYSPKNATDKFENLIKSAKAKINDYYAFTANQVTFVKNDETINQVSLKHFNQPLSFLFYSQAIKQNTSHWNYITHKFVSLKGLKYVVDCDLTFHRYQSCSFISQDTKLYKIDIKQFFAAATTPAPVLPSIFKWPSAPCPTDRHCINVLFPELPRQPFYLPTKPTKI